MKIKRKHLCILRHVFAISPIEWQELLKCIFIDYACVEQHHFGLKIICWFGEMRKLGQHLFPYLICTATRPLHLKSPLRRLVIRITITVSHEVTANFRYRKHSCDWLQNLHTRVDIEYDVPSLEERVEQNALVIESIPTLLSSLVFTFTVCFAEWRRWSCALVQHILCRDLMESTIACFEKRK